MCASKRFLIHFSLSRSTPFQPLVYFQQNPPGRMLNRLSTDLHRVDLLIPDRLFQFLDNVFAVISAAILATVAVPWLALAIVPAFFAVKWMQAAFRATARQILR